MVFFGNFFCQTLSNSVKNDIMGTIIIEVSCMNQDINTDKEKIKYTIENHLVCDE